jgi:hypothetical protein
MRENKEKIRCEERAAAFNQINKNPDVIYVCGPTQYGDLQIFLSGLLKKLKDSEYSEQLRADRNGNYKLYKLIKKYSDSGELIHLEPDTVS